ncbi:MAG: hypothetical protein NW226_20780 [Microscillaceae bacterium]|nr:hypothetical protein [Microscillaceae bacterium]
MITKITAVRMHADWCEASRAMCRYYEDLKNRFDGQEVLFVTLDYTNGTTRHQSQLLACALGLEDAIEPYYGTGHIILLTYRGKQVFGRLTPSLSFEEMAKLISKKL